MKKNFIDSNIDSTQILHTLVIDYLKRKQRKAKWRWVKRALVIIVLFMLGVGLWVNVQKDLGPHVGLIDIKGPIGDGPVSSGDLLMKEMGNAYRNSKSLKAVILRIDSPGGSPVQADYMYQVVRYYQKKHPDIKVYAVCVDLCASAAYYVATAADMIYANPASLVGSIGVIYNGFGAVDAMHKLGIDNRTQTAWMNKGFLDPFSPEKPEEKAFIHQLFIARVKEGRGSRLHIDSQTFSGLIWTGSQAKEMGLIDDFASSGMVARDIIKVEKIIDYTEKANMFEQLMQNVGASMSSQLYLLLSGKSGIKE